MDERWSEETLAQHARVLAGLHHAGIDTMRVIVTKDSGRWCAQGLEIDYAVEATSFEDVITQFAHSLTLTVDDHLRMHGHIGYVVRAAPPDVWSTFFDGVYYETFEVKTDVLSLHAIPAWVYVDKAA